MFSVAVEGWDEFIRDLRTLGQTGAQKEMVRELDSVAGQIASDAQGRAHRHISGAIRKGSRSSMPAVIVNGSQAPDAKLWEFSGRHPVFGNMDAWVYQEGRPYLGPAVDAHLTEAQDAVAKALDRALTAAGWT